MTLHSGGEKWEEEEEYDERGDEEFVANLTSGA